MANDTIKVTPGDLELVASNLRYIAEYCYNLNQKILNSEMDLSTSIKGSSAFALQASITKAIKLGRECQDDLNELALKLDTAKEDFIQADAISNISSVATTPYAAGTIASIDNLISKASKSGKLGDRTEFIENPLSRKIRRALKQPKFYEVVKPSVKLREGFGIGSAALAGYTAFADFENPENTTTGSKIGATVIDEGFTGAAYIFSDKVAEEAGGVAGVAIAETVVAAAGIAVAPEVVVAVGTIAGGVVAVAAVNAAASWGASKLKGVFNWH